MGHLLERKTPLMTSEAAGSANDLENTVQIQAVSTSLLAVHAEMQTSRKNGPHIFSL